MDTNFWLGLLSGGLIGALVAELMDISAWVAPKIIRKAAMRISNQALRERYEEEWLAELGAYDGLKLVKLSKAVGIWYGSTRTARQLSTERVVTIRNTIRSIVFTSIVLWRNSWGNDEKCTSIPHGLAINIGIIATLHHIKHEGKPIGLEGKSIESLVSEVTTPYKRTKPCQTLHRFTWLFAAGLFGVIISLSSTLSNREKLRLCIQSINRVFERKKPVKGQGETKV